MKYSAGQDHQETRAEELASAMLHGLGALLSIIALVLLVVYASLYGDAWRIVTLSIFGGCLVAVYGSSTLYHAVRSDRAKNTMRTCDRMCIYLLIAGTYTPFMLVKLGGGWGWSIFGLAWALAITGVFIEMLRPRRTETMSLLLYLAMGWLALLCAHKVIAESSEIGLVFLIAGGLAYTSGLLFYLWDHLPYNHAIWHVFVLAGSLFHVLAICQDVLPMSS